MGIGTIDGVVGAAVAVLTAAVGVGRWALKRARRRKKEKAAKERLTIPARMEEPAATLRPKRVRRAAPRPVGRQPRGWVHRWRDW